jgi:hypothetical protein
LNPSSQPRLMAASTDFFAAATDSGALSRIDVASAIAR